VITRRQHLTGLFALAAAPAFALSRFGEAG
jgi:hypothetical protein